MNDKASDPERLVDLAEGGFSSMGSDLRVARSTGASYDVDAGLLRFSALVAVAPAAAVIGTSAAASAAPAGAGALAPGAVSAGSAVTSAAASAAVTSAATTSAAVTSAATTSAATTAVTATGTAAKLAVAAKLGFGMKTIAAAVIATSAIGVAGYEVATSPTSPSSLEQPALVVGDDRAQTADGARRAPAPLERPRSLEAPRPSEASAPLDAPAEPPPVAPIEAHSEPPAVVAPAVVAPTSSPASVPPPPAPPPSTALAPTANGTVASSVRPEMEQLAKVRSAGDPSRQVRLAEEGHRLYPRGVFFQEREAIAIDALSRLGRSGEAAERARLYVARYPKSPYVETFRRIAGP